MRILAIDPSPDKHAWVMWDSETHDFFGLGFGLDAEEELLCSTSRFPSPHLVAIEFPQSYGINAGLSLFATAFEAGKLAKYFAGIADDVALFGRPTIKGQIGGRTDAEIRRSLQMRHGEARKGQKLYGVRKDIWAALALAVALDENPNLRRVEW